MIIRDKETGTLWQHATGEGLIGPLQGKHLEPLGGERMTWAAWGDHHPRTTVAVRRDEWPGLLSLGRTEKLLQVATRSGNVPGLTTTDRRLPLEGAVIGLEISGQSCAYPLHLLMEEELIHDTLGQTPVLLVYHADGDRVQAFKRSSSQRITSLQGISSLAPIPFERQRWNGWFEFHPQTRIFRRGG